jgi:hypothetical protein
VGIELAGFDLTDATSEGVTWRMYRAGSGPGVIGVALILTGSADILRRHRSEGTT